MQLQNKVYDQFKYIYLNNVIMSIQVILFENLNMNYLKERENVRDYNSIKENKSY